MPIQIGKWIRGMKLDRFFKELFQGKNNEELKEAATRGVLLVEKLKEFTDSPTVDLVTAIIPGDWDSTVVSKVRAVLPGILDAYSKNSPCLDKATLSEKVTCLIGNVKLNSDVNERTIFYHSLAGAFGAALSDGKFTLSDLFLFIEPIHRLLKKK